MKAWNLQNFGLENLKLVDVLTPKSGPNDLLVKVSAVSLNFRDKAIDDGIYEPEMIPKPLPMYETLNHLSGTAAEGRRAARPGIH